MKRASVVSGLVLLLIPASALTGNWPSIRGPGGPRWQEDLGPLDPGLFGDAELLAGRKVARTHSRGFRGVIL